MTRFLVGAMALSLTVAASGVTIGDEGQAIKIGDCPAAVKKTMEHEAKGAKFEGVEKITEDGAITYGAGVVVGGRKRKGKGSGAVVVSLRF